MALVILNCHHTIFVEIWSCFEVNCAESTAARPISRQNV